MDDAEEIKVAGTEFRIDADGYVRVPGFGDLGYLDEVMEIGETLNGLVDLIDE